MTPWPLTVLLVLAFCTAHTVRAQVLSPPTTYSSIEDPGGTNIIGAIEESISLLMIQHGVRRSPQEKTCQELRAPYFRDLHAVRTNSPAMGGW